MLCQIHIEGAQESNEEPDDSTTKSLCRDLRTQASGRLKIGVSLLVIGVALGAAYLGGSTGSARTAREQDVLREKQAVVYEKEITRIDEQLRAFHHEQVRRSAALKKVLQVYRRGVCLLHGTFTLKVKQEDTLVPLSGPDGDPLELEYIGSGFLASVKGHVITNRHVVEPWWHNEAVAPLLQQGLVPELIRLTATFPGKQPIPVDPSTVRLREDEVDVAVFQVEVKDVPVLPLFAGEVQAARGGRVVLLGYPTGLTAVLARAERDLAAEVVSRATDIATLISELASRNAISPVITQGALNEVMERRLVYDAKTTSGGSGGPVFGPDGAVIGINFAVTRDFDGSNFGVPIQYARNLLP